MVHNANSWYCNLSVNRYESQKTRDKRKRMNTARLLRDAEKKIEIKKTREPETRADN